MKRTAETDEAAKSCDLRLALATSIPVLGTPLPVPIIEPCRVLGRVFYAYGKPIEHKSGTLIYFQGPPRPPRPVIMVLVAGGVFSKFKPSGTVS